jgi:hypothetical protein
MITRGDVTDYFSVYEYGPVGRKIVYIFGGWLTIPAYHLPMIRSLVRAGYECVLFVPKRKLIAVGTPYEEIVTASRLVTAEVLHRIQVDKKKGTREFVSFGISLGTLFAAELAKQSPEIHKLVLFSPFGDFAAHVEIWPGHKHFGKILASQPTDRRASGDVLNKVGVGQGVERLRGKKVLIGYSNKDTNIHTHVIENLIRLMNRSGIDLESVIVRGGHIRGLIYLMGISKAYKKFLFSKKA